MAETWDDQVLETVNKCKDCTAKQDIEKLQQQIEIMEENIHKVQFGGE